MTATDPRDSKGRFVKKTQAAPIPDPVPEKSEKPERTVLSVVVTPALKQCLSEFSGERGVSPSSGLRMILTQRFRKRLEELGEIA